MSVACQLLSLGRSPYSFRLTQILQTRAQAPTALHCPPSQPTLQQPFAPCRPQSTPSQWQCRRYSTDCPCPCCAPC
ncbi:hypothetical protein FGO68_gene5949 [Halteria grandinella]|uniref:Uncharacterized protein n=1 Tax=Halteria grandinella TaxID=5974 RepID=A0A8J8T998_HALGN|nr:hypothetical protein FGO68_gene5949 [Halteria grandinella]